MIDFQCQNFFCLHEISKLGYKISVMIGFGGLHDLRDGRFCWVTRDLSDGRFWWVTRSQRW